MKPKSIRRPPGCKAFTLAEVLIAMAFSVMMIGGVVYGYIMSAKRGEWTAYSLAAESLAVQGLEQVRACRWDVISFPSVDEVQTTNFPTRTNILDVPSSGTNAVYATNFTTITDISASPPLKMIRVDCVWRFLTARCYTNTVVTYRGSDN